MGKATFRGAYAPSKKEVKKQYVIYADGFEEYRFDNEEDANKKLDECRKQEFLFRRKDWRNEGVCWYMNEVEA